MLLLTWTSCGDYDADDRANAFLGSGVSLALGISTHGNVTRMSDAVVQEEGSVYRGLDILSITPFAINGEDFANHDWKIVNTDVSSLQLGDAPRVDGTKETFFLYKTYDLTIGTNAFLVYGKPPVYSLDRAINGSLLYMSKEESSMEPLSDPITPNLQKLRFTLDPIYPTADVPSEAGLLAGYLTSIAQTTGWSTTTDEMLQNIFLFFTGQKNEENMMLAGSSANVVAHVNALSDTLNQISFESGSAGATLKTAILNNIEKTSYSKTIEGNLREMTLTFEDHKLKSFNFVYPAYIGLPDGAAALRWVKLSDTEYGFAPRTETTTMDNINNIRRFCYPAELFYYVNSRIDTSNSSVGEDVYKSYTDWNAVRSLYEYQPGTVTVNTKSVAIHDPLQYAVGRLKMTMKAETTTGKLKDSKGNDVTLTSNAFPLTGVIVCNQHPVDFNFKPILENGVASHVDDAFIYDSQVKKDEVTYCYLTTAEESIPSTLVLQTYDTGEGNDRKGSEVVTFVMEFLNNSGQTFYGKSCVIYPGTKFYLIGKANPLEATSSSAAPEAVGRVFTQDHVTTVNTKVESLANAYNVLPDLLGGRLELGVELVSSWVQAETTNVILK